MDTIMIIRDSVATCMKGTAEICQPCVKEAETTWQDVVIVGLVFAAILLIAYWIINGAFKLGTHIYTNRVNRRHELEDRKAKQLADLLEKRLSFMEAQTKKENTFKIEEDKGNNYLSLLKELTSIKENDKEA